MFSGHPTPPHGPVRQATMVAVFVAPSVALVADVATDSGPHKIPLLLSAAGTTRSCKLGEMPVFLQAITPPSAGSPIAVVVLKTHLTHRPLPHN